MKASSLAWTSMLVSWNSHTTKLVLVKSRVNAGANTDYDATQMLELRGRD